MISKLQLLKFGKFQKSDFDLSPSVTIFQGKNESGKTTIFDALRLGIGSKFLTASQEPKKSILSRYGDKSLEGYQLVGEIPELSKDAAPQYVHCVSLREGELEFAFNNEKMIKPEFLRSKLLNNGVNLEGISSSLKKIYSPKTGSKDSNFVETLKKEISDLKSKRIRLTSEIESLHSRNKNNVEMEGKHLKDQERVNEIKEKLSQLEKEFFLDSKIQKKIQLLDSLSKIQRLKSLEETLKKNFLYSKDESSVYENLQKEIDKVQSSLTSSETLLQDKQKAIDLKKKESDSFKNQISLLQKMKVKAEESIEKIDKTLREEGFTEEVRTDLSNSNQKVIGGGIAGFGFLGLMGVLISLLVANVSPFGLLIGSLVSAGAIGVGLYLFTQKKESLEMRYSSAKERDAVSKRLNEWNLTFPENPISPIDRMDILRQFLAKQIQNFESKSEQIETLEKELKVLTETLETIQSKGKLEREKLSELQSKRNSWLNERRITTIQEYHKQVAEFQSQSKILAETSQKLRSTNAGKNPEELEIQWKTEISTLDEIPTQGLQEAEKLSKNSQKKELETELQSLEKRLNELKTEIKVEDTRIQDSLPEKEKDLISTLQLLAEKEKEFLSLESRRKSAKIAQEIVEDISKDQSFQFVSIASEIRKDLNLLLPKREVSFEALDKKELIKMEDAAGQLRSIDHLSGGTLATFYLIFKLFLARKTVPKNGILLLDEPFVHLDPVRVQSALSYLKSFQEETEYQICFFTKQEELSETILKIFKKAKKISLE
ncbi:DNA repair protein Rad50 [Leptospira tipperaryensis]|uniref:DNA repair protein Rad50 n=1 Tax=Leptospira tipperaryensis TaxID=2564040 RepID=A0A1D7V0N9_9LEPT|nr:AAA family ATPase [Leptospira tipperaryensis]AOP35390.1 DNA repair protein Rad50 [Leptospira tipperaryensis]